MVTVVVPLDERLMVRLVGEAVRVKLPAATVVTVRVTVAMWDVPAPVPVTLIV